METPVPRPRKCYVLGAGFSHACGLPPASELTEKVYHHTFDGPQIAALNDAANRRTRQMQFFFPRSDCNGDWPDFEQLLTFVHEYQDFAVDFAGTGGAVPPTADVTHLKESLIRGLGTMLADKTRAVTPQSTRSVQRLAQRAIKEAAPVITFNWDCLLEIACREAGQEWIYRGRDASGLQVIKPHGSINLVETSVAKYETEYRRAINIRDIVELQRSNDRIVLMSANPDDAGNRTLAPFATDEWLIVPPGARKSFDSQWVKEQWRYALGALREATAITVIGYSLPEFDVRSRLLFRLANVRRPAPAMRIIDPNPDPIAKRLVLLGYDNIEPIPRRWEEWISDG